MTWAGWVLVALVLLAAGGLLWIWDARPRRPTDDVEPPYSEWPL